MFILDSWANHRAQLPLSIMPNASPKVLEDEELDVNTLNLNDRPNESRVLLQQTFLEIHRFISRQNSALASVLHDEEGICSECCGAKLIKEIGDESPKPELQVKQINLDRDREQEDVAPKCGKTSKPKQYGSVFSKLGSYRHKKSSSANISEAVKQKSSSPSDGLALPKTPPLMIKEKHTCYAQTSAEQNLNSNTSVQNAAGSSKTVNTGYFQWRRVATKLGIDRSISEDHSKEQDSVGDSLHDFHGHHSLVVDIPSLIELQSSSIESLDEVPQDLFDTEDEQNLLYLDNEPEAWSVTVDKKTLKKMTAKNIKKQDHIWEFVQTEKSHCRTLKIMHRVFVIGMMRELNISKDMADRIFPRLDDLLDIHLTFLGHLLAAQRKSVDRSINDFGQLLLQQFEGQMTVKMKTAFGEFCSLQTEAIQLYKDLLKTDVGFQAFIKKCSRNSLCKRLGIPECILLVTQRITKYPLLIEPIMKTSPENSRDRRALIRCLTLIRDVIDHIEHQVEARTKELRLFEVYNKLDARSTATLNGRKFKKSDLLSNKRKLIHDGPIKWMSARGKPFEVLAVVLSDVIFFLVENNQKCAFFSQDNKSSVISLGKLIVREKGDTKDSKGMYLICQSKTEPEMYEFTCRSADDRRQWIRIIRDAINNCSEEGEPSAFEEERKLQEATDARLRQLIDQLHYKDSTIIINCREKMAIALEILEIFAKDDLSNYLKLSDKDANVWKIFMPEAIMQSVFLEVTRLFALMQPVARCIGIQPNVPANESEQEAGIKPLSPNQDKSSETHERFCLAKVVEVETSQFDQSHVKNSNGADKTFVSDCGVEPQSGIQRINLLQEPLLLQTNNEDEVLSNGILTSTSQLNIAVAKEQCMSLARILQLVHQLAHASSHQTTELESLFGQLAEANGKSARLKTENERILRERKLPSYHPDKQLEELRSLQSQIQQQKSDLEQTKDEHLKMINKQREELLQIQKAIDREREEIRCQREDVHRQKELLQKQVNVFEEHKTNGVKDDSPHAKDQAGSMEDLAVWKHHRNHKNDTVDRSFCIRSVVHQNVLGGASQQRCVSYDRLQCVEILRDGFDEGKSRQPDRMDRTRRTVGQTGCNKSITRMQSMSAVPSRCLSPTVLSPGGVSRRQSVLIPVQAQQQSPASDEQSAESAAQPAKLMSRSLSKDSDSSLSRRSSRATSTASSTSLSSKLLAAFSSRLPLAAELLRLSKDRSTSLTSVASVSQSMPSSPKSMMRCHLGGIDGFDGKPPSKYSPAVGHSLSSSPPLVSERHVLRRKLMSTLSTGNFLPLRFGDSHRPKSASASPQHSSVAALKHSKHAKRGFTGSQESIHSLKTASTNKDSDVFYV